MKFVGISNAFHETAKMLLPKFNTAFREINNSDKKNTDIDIMLISPIMANGAFSLELSLKAIHIFEYNSEFAHTHNLWCLYSQLPKLTQENIQIKGSFEKHDLENTIKINSNVFEEMRYMEISKKKKRNAIRTDQPAGDIQANPVGLLQIADAALFHAKYLVSKLNLSMEI